jgi:general secretion pathway protein B
MSFILDALRKSEAEKARGEAPSLLVSGSPRVRPLARGLIVALVVALAINAGVLAVWMLRQGPAQTPAPVATVTPVAPANAPIEATVATLPASGPVSGRASVPVAQPPLPVEAPSTAAFAASELPETDVVLPERVTTPDDVVTDAAAMAPAIEISTHVFSDDPTLRAVTIDGRRLREGDEIRPGTWLVEITESGIVVETDGVRSEMDVLQDWR